MTDPTRPGDPMRRDPGRWCDQHQRYECTKHGKGGSTCHGSRIEGLDACRMHAGQKGAIAKTRGEAVTAWSALSGKPVISHTEAVLGMLQMSWLRVHLYAGLLEQQVTAAQEAAVREPADAEVRAAVSAAYGVDVDDTPGQGAPPVGPGTGLIGHTFSGVKDIGIFATGEAIRGLTQLEAAERDRCVKYAKTAHDMGIAEREVQLAEQHGALLAGVIGRVLDALGLSPEQQRLVAVVVPRELRAVAGGETG